MTIACDLHFANYISFLMLMLALYLNFYRADRNEIASKLMSGGLKDDLILFIGVSDTSIYMCLEF